MFERFSMPRSPRRFFSAPSLAFTGVFVFGIFRKIAVGSRDSDLFWQIHIHLVIERVDFHLQLAFNFCQWVGHIFTPITSVMSDFRVKKYAESGNAKLRYPTL